MENHELEAVVAAILATGMASSDGSTATAMVKRYRTILHEIRVTGDLSRAEAPREKGTKPKIGGIHTDR